MGFIRTKGIFYFLCALESLGWDTYVMGSLASLISLESMDYSDLMVPRIINDMQVGIQGSSWSTGPQGSCDPYIGSVKSLGWDTYAFRSLGSLVYLV